jgi:methylenetetrahydrofolate reductase (NADPH)
MRGSQGLALEGFYRRERRDSQRFAEKRFFPRDSGRSSGNARSPFGTRSLGLNEMHSLKEKLLETNDFLVGVELVSIRGSMAERSAVKARTFANQLVDCSHIDWISITDNAGGNPQLAPQALGKPILYAGKEVVIHLTCKDLNRNGLESEAWLLNSEGFHNVLAMTGDYPVSGNGGLAKPVFDLDSVGLISMLKRMNQGQLLQDNANGAKNPPLEKTQFLIGAVTTNFKQYEGEVVPQLLKLEKKVECGAHFIINQVGFDSRKMHELRAWMDQHQMPQTPLVGNVYVLSPRVAQIFHEKRIPGIVVTDDLLELCRRQAASPDEGRGFFLEFAAKQMAIYRGLGYRGAYLGGIYSFGAIDRILEIERSFAPDDWKTFAREIRFSAPGEYFCFEQDAATGLANPDRPNVTAGASKAKRGGLSYALAKWSHSLMFSRGTALAKLGASVYRAAGNPEQGPRLGRALEHASKSLLFKCKDCGDCSLPEIAFLCPESQCAKNQRNGPCGGTREGRCEVDGFGDCIWLRAYERLRPEGKAEGMLQHAPVLQSQGLRGTSAWANFWLGKDHTGKENSKLQTPSSKEIPSSKSQTEPQTTAHVS